MTGDEEEFDHQVTAWTVGDLRRAMEGLPDDFPVTVITAEEPGSHIAGDEQVIIRASPWISAPAWLGSVPASSADEVRARLASGDVQPDHFEISLEFPSGRYYRRTR